MLLSSRLSLIVAILGISFLIGLLFLEPKNVQTGEIAMLGEGSYVFFEGKVISQRTFDDFSILNVEGIEATCKCETFFEGDNVEISGIVEIYEGDKQIRALKIVSK